MIELILKKLENLTRDIYQLRRDMLKELGTKQENINRVSVSISDWAEPQMTENAEQITDIQEQMVETAYQEIIDGLED